jgi:hypothetical protein
MPIKPDTPRCGAPKENGTPCRRPAGAGTRHKGHGLCRTHETPDAPPRRLTPGLIRDFAALCEVCPFLQTVCDLLVVPREDANNWIKAGEAELNRRATERDVADGVLPADTDVPKPAPLSQLQVEFFVRVQAARAKNERGLLDELDSACKPREYKIGDKGSPFAVVYVGGKALLPPDPKILLETLKIKFPDRYGGRQKVEVSGPGGKPVALSIGVAEVLNDERATELACELAERLAAAGNSDAGGTGQGDH